MSGSPSRRVLPDAERPAQPPCRSPPPAKTWRRWPLALAVAALLSASLVTSAAIAAVLRQDAGPARRVSAPPVLVNSTEAKPVDLRVGPHRFRTPRAYFRHPPHPSGVGTGFYVRALWPDMEPETEKARAAYRTSIRTEEGQRVLLILLEQNQPGVPWPVARWMLQNAARGPSRAEADRADLEAFSPPSPAAFGLHALLAQREPGATWVHDLFHGALADGRFAGTRCGRDPDPDRPTSCNLRFDWRQGTRPEVTFIRTRLPRWREIAEATDALVDRWAVGGGG